MPGINPFKPSLEQLSLQLLILLSGKLKTEMLIYVKEFLEWELEF